MNAIALATQLEATTLFRPEALVTIENLQVRFGDVVAVESLGFTVRRGEFVSLLGPSGCGKSTLLRTIARLVPVASGKVVLRDPSLRIGFMFQKPLLLPWRTTLDNVLLPVEIQFGSSVVDAADRHRASLMLDLVGLSPQTLHRLPHEFSGGQCQRIGLARALMLPLSLSANGVDSFSQSVCRCSRPGPR